MEMTERRSVNVRDRRSWLKTVAGFPQREVQAVVHPLPTSSRGLRQDRIRAVTAQNDACLKPVAMTSRVDAGASCQHATQDSYSSGYSGMSGSGQSATEATPGESPLNHANDDNMSGYLNDYSESGSFADRETSQSKTKRSKAHVMDVRVSTGDARAAASPSLVTADCHASLQWCEKLPELVSLPWSENELLQTLKEGRPRFMSGHITVEMIQRVCHRLQRPLLRIARHAQQLSSSLGVCTRHEVDAAVKSVLSRSLWRSCQHACAKALTLFSMTGETTKLSKASRCGLRFSVGRIHRWMVEARLAPHVQELAAVCLTATMQNLAEEVVLRALKQEELGEFSYLFYFISVKSSSCFSAVPRHVCHHFCSSYIQGCHTSHQVIIYSYIHVIQLIFQRQFPFAL